MSDQLVSDPSALYQAPNALARFYSRFAVDQRLLLTGHSHQAWPDIAFDGQGEAWLDAAELVDAKWDRAFAKADRVRSGFAQLLNDSSGAITLAPNTHDLLVRFLSALPLRERPKLVTTTGEFHTIRRQLGRLAEERIEVEAVPCDPVPQLADRLAASVDDRTAAVLASSVLFGDARIVPALGEVAKACQKHGAELLVDTYHSLNAVPFSVAGEGLEQAFIVGGGYKYCQLGEGNCFLRVPPHCTLRPVVTGWYSEFAELAQAPAGQVAYGQGHARFAGATYDPASNYRAAAVLDFFAERGLSPEFLRMVSQHQIGLLVRRFDALDLDPKIVARDQAVSLEDLGGFLALRSPCAGALQDGLAKGGVSTDYRDQTLRLGPAPYLCDAQLEAAMDRLGEVARTMKEPG